MTTCQEMAPPTSIINQEEALSDLLHADLMEAFFSGVCVLGFGFYFFKQAFTAGLDGLKVNM